MSKSYEQDYLNLVSRVLNNGELRKTRNSSTLSVFGEQLKIELNGNSIPLLTTKVVSFKHIFHELMFFLNGSTDTKYLENVGVNIWKGNTSREYLDSRGLDYREGVYGPAYGFQWNHFGAKYKGPDIDYNCQGVNQIDECVNLIKTDPMSRRILFNAWNAADLNLMALQPCHILFQFYVRKNKFGENEFLDGQMYQRSADLMLGVPYNIASYSLLLNLVSRATKLTPGVLTVCFGDLHIYEDHIEGAKIQILRIPEIPPTISFLNSVDTPIRDYKLEDTLISGYTPQSAIRMKMIV